MRLLVLSVLLMARPFSASAWQGNPTLELEIEEAVRNLSTTMDTLRD